MRNACIQVEPLDKPTITAGGIEEDLLQELMTQMSKIVVVYKLRGAYGRKVPLRAGWHGQVLVLPLQEGGGVHVPFSKHILLPVPSTKHEYTTTSPSWNTAQRTTPLATWRGGPQDTPVQGHDGLGQPVREGHSQKRIQLAVRVIHGLLGLQKCVRARHGRLRTSVASVH